MTLATCKIRLEIAKKADNKAEIALWEKRILIKSPKEVVSDGKKSKR